MTQAGKQLARARLDCLCRLVTDGTHDSPKLQQSGIPFVKGKHISGGYVDLENCDHITKEDHEKAIQRSKPERGDILFSNIGSVGDAAFINIDKEFSIKNVALFKPDSDVVDSKYLYYVVLCPKFRGELFAKRLGVAQPFFSLEMLRSHEVEYHHDLTIQKKIASILSAYDDLIENNLRQIKILEEMAQALYREWFVKFRFPGHEKTRMVDSPLGKIPEGWEVVKVGSLLEKIKRKKRVKKQDYESGGTIPVVDQGRDFIGGYTPDQESLHDKPLPIIVFGDHTRVLKYIDFPFACGADGTQLLRPNTERMPTSLFFYALKSIDLSDFAYARHFKFLKEQGILVPDEQAVQSFAQVADQIRDQIRCLLRRNATLRQTRDLLLPKLISGELDVSDLDIKTGGPIQ